MKLGTLDPRRFRRPQPPAGVVAIPPARGRARPPTSTVTAITTLKITTEWHGRTMVLVLDGDLDLHTAPTVREAIESALAQGPRRLVVDLSAVRFLNSAGLTVLLDGHRAAASRTDLRLVATTRATWRPLQITRVHERLVIHSSRAAAVAAPAREAGHAPAALILPG
ncbi:STAS domain-containing protein [Amycolatopsis sp. NBC_00345]|uniref:STAS domain-containing protein n=1 Tax=Amycolatopsis sp. NBC_00345 TaxID=2975955 RepID=UPI002E25D9C6